MEQLATLFTIAVYVSLVSNFGLAQFLGLCPFLGVTRKTSSAFGMGLAVTFVMTMASAITWFVYYFLLLPGAQNLLPAATLEGLGPEGLAPVLSTGAFILVIASLVQLVEMVIRKTSPGLYDALGIYLPLITTNCAVLGVALLSTRRAAWDYNLLETVTQGFFAGVGFMIAMLLMSGVRESLEHANVPRCFKGAPIAFVATGLMALAFMGFSGLVTLAK